MRMVSVRTGAILLALGVTAAAMGACGGRSPLDADDDDGVADASSDVSSDASPDASGDSTEDTGIDGAPRDGGADVSPLDGPSDSHAGPEADAPRDVATDAPVLAAPRPIAPLSTSTTTSQQPTLRWQLDPGSDGAFVEICSDRACAKVLQTFGAAGTSARPPSALPAGVYFWRLHGTAGGIVRPGVSPTWELFVGARSAPVDTSWGSVPDIDGDGLADGLTAFDNQNDNASGVVFSYHGTPNGLTIWTAFGPPPNVQSPFFGLRTAMAGDVDGDGYPDLLVGDDYHAWLYPGGPSGVVLTPTLLPDAAGLVNALIGLGDVEGDGYADVALGLITNNNHAVVVYHGGPNGLSSGTTLAVPGWPAQGLYPIGTDINGDGFGDVISQGCVPGAAFDCSLYVFSGGPAGFPSTPVVEQMVSGEGAGVTLAGDVNGDGYPDLFDVVPDPSRPDASSSTYVIRLFPGGAAGIGAPFLFAAPSAIGAEPDGTLLTVGDVNGDGFADVGVGIANNSPPNGLWIYTGSASPGVQTWPPAQVYPASQTARPSMYSAAGDVNGDGYGDVLAGDWQVTNTAYLYLGSASGVYIAPNNASVGGGDSVL